MLLGELIDLLVEVPRDIPFEEFRVLLGHVSNFPRFEVPPIQKKKRNFSSLCWSLPFRARFLAAMPARRDVLLPAFQQGVDRRERVLQQLEG